MMLNQGAPKALLNNKGEKGRHRVILTGEEGTGGLQHVQGQPHSDRGLAQVSSMRRR